VIENSVLRGLIQAKEEQQANAPHHSYCVSQYKNYTVGEIGYFLPTIEEAASARRMLLRSGHVRVEGRDPLKTRHQWTVGSLHLVRAIECNDLLGPRALAGGQSYSIEGDAAMMAGERGTYPLSPASGGEKWYDKIGLPQGRMGAVTLQRMADMFAVSHQLRGAGYHVFVSQRAVSSETLPEEGQLSDTVPPSVWKGIDPAPCRMCVLVTGKPNSQNWYELLVLDTNIVMCHEYNYTDHQRLAMRTTLAEIMPALAQTL